MEVGKLDYDSRREKLDFPLLIYRQIDRINMLFCETSISRGGGIIRSIPMQNTYMAINALELMIRPKLNNALLKELHDTKTKAHIRDSLIEISDVNYMRNSFYYGLLMELIKKANLLPSDRTSFSTGED